MTEFNFRTQLDNLGLTIGEVCEAIGISRNTLNRWFNEYPRMSGDHEERINAGIERVRALKGEN